MGQAQYIMGYDDAVSDVRAGRVPGLGATDGGGSGGSPAITSAFKRIAVLPGLAEGESFEWEPFANSEAGMFVQFDATVTGTTTDASDFDNPYTTFVNPADIKAVVGDNGLALLVLSYFVAVRHGFAFVGSTESARSTSGTSHGNRAALVATVDGEIRVLQDLGYGTWGT